MESNMQKFEVKAYEISRTYYDCGNASHRHLDKYIAEKCAAKGKPKPAFRWAESDTATMCRMREERKTLKHIAEVFNTSQGMVLNLTGKQWRKERKAKKLAEQ